MKLKPEHFTYLQHAAHPDNWFYLKSEGITCHVCGKKQEGLHIQHDFEIICFTCLMKILEDFSSDSFYYFVNEIRIKKIMASSGSMIDRIALIRHLPAVISHFHNQGPAKLQVLMDHIILWMGVSDQHPLGPFLRILTLTQILRCRLENQDDVFLYSLEDLRGLTVSDQYSLDKVIMNFAAIVGQRNIHDPDSQAIIEAAVQIAGEQNYAHVKTWFSRKNDIWCARPFSASIRDFFDRDFLQYRYTPGKSDDFIKTIDRSASNVADCYTVTQLKALYNAYFKPVMNDLQWPLLTSPKGRGLSKWDYVKLFIKAFKSTEFCLEFKHKLPEWMFHILTSMVQTGRTWSYRELANSSGGTYANQLKAPSYYSISVPKGLELFQYSEGRYFDNDRLYFNIDPDLAQLFREHLIPIKPELPLESLSDNLQLLNDSDRIPSLWIALNDYYHQKGIKWSKNGMHILKSCLKEVQSEFRIHEPYKHIKGLEYLRTSLMLTLLDYFWDEWDEKDDFKTINMNDEIDTGQFLRSLFTKVFTAVNIDRHSRESDQSAFSLFNPLSLLSHIKIDSHFESIGYSSQKIKQDYQILLRFLYDQNTIHWISVDDLYNRFYQSNQTLFPLPWKRFSTIFSCRSLENSYTNNRQILSHENRYLLEIPYLKLLLWMLNVLGVVNLAFHDPSNDNATVQGKEYLTAFDGIQQFSLTPYGEFLLGKTDDLSLNVTENRTRIDLDENKLIIRVQNESPMVSIILKQCAEQLVPNLYEVTSSSFLGDCTDSHQIEAKIERFSSTVDSDLPPLWRDFFDLLIQNSNAFTADSREYLVFQVDPFNHELHRYISNDQTMKFICKRADDYTLMVQKENFHLFRSRLLERGFLLPPSHHPQL